ncbi:hypothetical protein P7C73_g1939, partial [Tremellales sp. Uapishka_1]
MSFLSALGLHGQLGSRLAGVLGFTVAFQAAFAAYAVPTQTEKYYDLAGSLGFITTTALSMYYPSVKSLFTNGPRIPFHLPTTAFFHPRQLIISGLMILWAGRIGSFLLQRVLKAGKDSRFDDLKTKPLIFTGMWFGQAVWVSTVALPAILVNSIPRAAMPALGLRDLLAVGIWAGGLGLEILADREKSAWRSAKEAKKHEEKFISSGLWAFSRHPNYLGEFILQFGPPVLALSAFPAGSPLKYLVFASPLFTYTLLRYASGVPPLEQSGEKKWGSDEGWRKYVKDTSVMIPWPGGLGKGKAA